MPLLRGQKFVKQKPPSGLDLNDEVFFSPITLEIFKTYEELFSRTLLVNGRSWSCSMCLKSNLTYLEAIDCEVNDFKQISVFGNGLLRAILKIVSSVRVTEVNPLLDLINKFGYSRYFIGEIIEYKTDDMTSYKPGLIEFITINNEIANKNQGPFPSSNSLLYYIVDYEKGKKQDEERLILSYEFVKRKYPNLLNLEKLRYLIRRTCEFQSDILMPKLEFLQRCQIYPHGPITWSDIFPGVEPSWSSFLPSSSFKRNSLQTISFGQNDKNYQSLFPGKLEKEQSRKLMLQKTCQINSPIIKGQKVSTNETKLNDSQIKIEGSNGGQNSSNLNLNESRMSDSNSKHIRAEMNDLTSEWCSINTRDDLECPDLLPLPEFAKIDTDLTNKEFSMLIQIIEFYHKFSNHLSLMVPWLRADKSTEPFSTTQTCWDQTGKPINYILSSSGFMNIEDLDLILRMKDPSGPFADLIIGLMLAIRRLENELNSKPPTSSALATAGAASSVVGSSSLCITNNESFGFISQLMTTLSSTTNLGLGATLDSVSPYFEMVQSSKEMPEKLLLLYRKSAISSMISELVGISTQVASGKAGKAAITFASQLSGDQLNQSISSMNSSLNMSSTEMSSQTSLARACAIAASTGSMSQVGLDRVSLSYALYLHFMTSPARGGGFRGQIWGGTRPYDDPAFMFLRDNHEIIQKLQTDNIYELSVGEKLLIMTTLMEEILIQPQMREVIELSCEKSRHLRTQIKSILIPVTTTTTTNPTESTLPDDKNEGKSKGVVGKSPIVKKTPIDNGGNSSYKLTPASIANEKPPIETELQKDVLFWETIFDLTSKGNMTPLGQDRLHRTYWLVLSIPALLIEPPPEEIIHGELGSVYDHNGRKRKKRPMKVLVKQIPQNLTLGMNCEEVLDNSTKLLKEIESNGNYANFGVNANYLIKTGEIGKREAMLNQLSAEFPIKFHRDKIDLEFLRSLSNPDIPTNQEEHLRHPAVKQVYDYSLSSDNQKWSILYPDECIIMNEEYNHNAIVNLLKKLEVCLNPRGIREQKLRHSINNYRSIILRSMKSCPLDFFLPSKKSNLSTEMVDVRNEEKESVDISEPSEIKKSRLESDVEVMPDQRKTSQEILVSWLNRNLSQLKQRLTRKTNNFVNFETDFENLFMPDEIKTIKDFLNHDFHDDVKRCCRKLLKIFLSVNPFYLSGSMSSEDKTLRGGLAFLFFIKNSQFREALLTSNKLESDDCESQIALQCHRQTNGLQRWISCVINAKSASEVHLLSRTLERAARKTAIMIKGIKSNMHNYADINPLPEIICSSCHLPFNENSSYKTSNSLESQFNTLTFLGFIRCSTCACPFHYSCLVDSNPRANRGTGNVSVRKKSSWNNSNNQINPKAALLLGQFTAFSNSNNQKYSDASEIFQSSLLSCQACKKLAGFDSKWKDSLDKLPLKYKEIEKSLEKTSSSDQDKKSLVSKSIANENILPDQNAISIKNSKKRSISRTSIGDENETKKIIIAPIASKAKQNQISSQSTPSETTGSTRKKKNGQILETSQDLKENKPNVVNDKNSAIEFMKELMALPSAKPLNKCGLSKSYNYHDEFEKKNKNAKLYAQDLNGLQDCLLRDGFPNGPLQIIPQLKILLQRWITLNREGSRLHQCAIDLKNFIDQKFNEDVSTDKPLLRTRKIPKKIQI